MQPFTLYHQSALRWIAVAAMSFAMAFANLPAASLWAL